MSYRDYNATTTSDTRLYIRGFNTRTPDSEIYDLCTRFGKVLNVDIIPGKSFGFVTFGSHDAAAMAVYRLNEELFKGRTLQVDFAKVKKQDDNNNNSNNNNYYNNKGGNREGQPPQQPQPQPPPQPQGQPQGGVKDEKEKVVKDDKARYIPGAAVVESAKRPPKSNGTSKTPASTPPVPPSAQPVTSAPPPPTQTPATFLPTYTEQYPNLEITINDTINHDIKYQFRVKSLAALKHFLALEGDLVDPAQLLLASAPPKEKTNITFAGIPVVHVYSDLLGTEMLEPRDNRPQRDSDLRILRKTNKYKIPPAKIPLSHSQVPCSELQNFLTQKGYQLVHINVDSNAGPLAPLHPSWVPLANSYTYQKSHSIIYFTVDGPFVSSCDLFSATNVTYKDLLPILLKYNICIFNTTKRSFITPEQLQ